VLFGLGIQATFSGPLKYSILPAQLAVDELVAGNGLVEAAPGAEARRGFLNVVPNQPERHSSDHNRASP
jgi:hypothetical protein